MKKVQTRRSVSLSALGYKRAETLAHRQGKSVSGLVEELIEASAKADGVEVDGDAAKAEMMRRRAVKVRSDDDVAAGIWTF